MNYIHVLASTALCMSAVCAVAETPIANAYGRDTYSLNGEWHAIIDPYERGRWDMWKNRKPQNNNEFREFSFDEGLTLNVPGDFNSQMPELKYYEGTVWYGRYFDIPAPAEGEKLYLYFAGASYATDVFLNAEPIGRHEGGFTPFQFDITDKVRDKDNFIAVAVNNARHPDAIPAMNFDWWNYGGITRDVFIVRVPEKHIKDYYIRLDKNDPELIHADIVLSEKQSGETVTLQIPELKVARSVTTDSLGKASLSFPAKKLRRWDVCDPKLYDVTLICGSDTVSEQIGFRNIATRGREILLNGKPIFLCGVSFHEEIPQRKGRAYSETDAAMLLNEAKALGVNFVRLAHYPQNEHTVRLAEKMGILLWEEIPIWQNIAFDNDSTLAHAKSMMADMVNRDKNRAAVVFWGISNETRPSEARNHFLASLRDTALSIDDSRLISAAFDNSRWNSASNCYEITDDPALDYVDVVGVNKYVGWYDNWRVAPENTGWNVAADKPLLFSEFGGEAQYGRFGNREAKWSWSEDFQADLYRKNLKMFAGIPNLAGLCPWILFDFRSPTRFSPLQGLEFNRKGLVSDRGERKKAWYIMRDFYSSHADTHKTR